MIDISAAFIFKLNKVLIVTPKYEILDPLWSILPMQHQFMHQQKNLYKPFIVPFQYY